MAFPRNEYIVGQSSFVEELYLMANQSSTFFVLLCLHLFFLSPAAAAAFVNQHSSDADKMSRRIGLITGLWIINDSEVEIYFR